MDDESRNYSERRRSDSRLDLIKVSEGHEGTLER